MFALNESNIHLQFPVLGLRGLLLKRNVGTPGSPLPAMLDAIAPDHTKLLRCLPIQQPLLRLMVILVRATTRLWAPQALVLAAQPRATSSFQNLLAKSALHTSAAAAAQQRSPGGVGGTAVRELRPYATVVPAAERLVVIGDVHGDIGEL